MKNREGSLQLLGAAADEACQERDTKGFWNDTKKERERQRRALQKARKEVERSLKTAAAALEHFLVVAREVTPYARKRFSFPAFSEAQEIVLKVEADNPGEIRSWLREWGNITERVRDMEKEYDPSPQGAGRKGPQNKAALNSTLLKLTDLFFGRMKTPSLNKALEYTHCLLYVAGIWRDPYFQPLAAKLSQLQKQITS